jgi:chemotaxis protein methyltransferase CheR
MAVQSRTGITKAEISEKTYQKFCQLIFQHSRIFLGPGRQGLLVSRLDTRRVKLGLETWENYIQLLNAGNNADEIDTLIDLIATNHTQFFREPSHFQRLADGLLEQLLLDCPQARQQLRCWSAATSSGEEAYSLAIMLSEFANSQAGSPGWSIEASDISRKALQRAESAIYALKALHLPRPELLARYFQRGSGPYEGQAKVKAAIRDQVKFRRINLFQESYSLTQPLHLIFCRNTLIYFQLESQKQLVSRLYSMLAPGGLFVIGHSDSLVQMQHSFSALGGGIYRRNP